MGLNDYTSPRPTTWFDRRHVTLHGTPCHTRTTDNIRFPMLNVVSAKYDKYIEISWDICVDVRLSKHTHMCMQTQQLFHALEITYANLLFSLHACMILPCLHGSHAIKYWCCLKITFNILSAPAVTIQPLRHLPWFPTALAPGGRGRIASHPRGVEHWEYISEAPERMRCQMSIDVNRSPMSNSWNNIQHVFFCVPCLGLKSHHFASPCRSKGMLQQGGAFATARPRKLWWCHVKMTPEFPNCWSMGIFIIALTVSLPR
jgi:hypothetical protein